MIKIVYLAITSGHLNGIGPEIILKSLLEIFHKPLNHSSKSDLHFLKEFKHKLLTGGRKEFLIIGSLAAFKWHARKVRISFSVMEEPNSGLDRLFPETNIYRMISIGNRNRTKKLLSSIPDSQKVLLIDIPIDISTYSHFDEFMSWAIPSNLAKIKGKKERNKYQIAQARIGKHAFKVLGVSKRLLISKQVGGMVNAPVSKESISRYNKLTDFKGQTEFYAQVFRIRKFSMTFFSPLFNLVLLTTHLPLSQVSKNITPSAINRGIDHALEIRRYLRDRRKILFLGLNPHAGEGGKIGGEDKLIQAIIKKHKYGKYIEGPVPADTAFVKVYRGDYKVVIAGYHDQGLIPLKSIGNNVRNSVNVTWGLPFIRTSVDHGTAFDIVGKNLAQPYSFISAWKTGLELMEK